MASQPSRLGRDNKATDGLALFRGRTVVIATMHGKEAVIAPPLEQSLGVRCQLPEGFDTDVLGTFTGETKRPGTALETARLKIRKALELTGASVGVASEGSFGPHPYYPFLPADYELLVFADQDSQLEVTAETISTQTNYGHCTASSPEEVVRFAAGAGFPAHGLILRADGLPVIKGIHDPEQLRSLAARLLRQRPAVTVETDMRAMHNPSRMRVIAECVQKLVRKLAEHCPSCGWVGYGVVERIPGLRCGQCRLPTAGIRAERYHCFRCGFEEERSSPEGKLYADPMYCDFCNP